MKVKKRSGHAANLDVTKIQKITLDATKDLMGVSQSELELDAQLKFYDGMSTVEIHKSLETTAIEKIDIDVPNWTFVAARLFLHDLYHRVGKTLKSTKGTKYGNLAHYINHCVSEGKMIPSLANGFDLDDLSTYIKPERDYLFNYLGVKTLYDRYLLKNREGNPIELPQQMFMGIAMFLAQNETDKQQRAKEFYDVISKFEVMLATPTLSNARTNRHQLSSCYIGSSPDNIEGIFDAFKEQSLLSKFGGGIGWDWNLIRALGGNIDNTKGAAGGTVPFLKIENDIAIAVDQLGTRKGAIAVYLEPWHMDIDDFLDLKKNSGEERRRAHDLFPSLWVNDLFMERILEDGNWTLFDPKDVPELSELNNEDFEIKYKQYEKDKSIRKETIKAKTLWKKILTSYFESGSPFLCFKDTANRANPNQHVGKIRSSNLCTEIFQNTSPNKYLTKLWLEDGSFEAIEEDTVITLADGTTKLAKKITSLDIIVVPGSTEHAQVYNVEKEKIDGKTAVCNLASLNLSKVNTQADIERVVPIGVRMLDNVIDLNFYPTKKVKDTNMLSRSIGFGIMGEAQMLAESQIYYGSQDHFNKIDTIMEQFSFNVIKSSMLLAKERGSYPDFEGSNWSKGITPQYHATDAARMLTNTNPNLPWAELTRDIKHNGMRNGYLMAIAPTSSISILVGTTQAIEPVYKRKWYEENLSGQIPVVVPNLSPETYQYYTPAYEVDQLQLIKAAAIRQKWLDQGQSTNVFMSLQKASGKHLHEIYTLAWQLGLKSTYYLRGQSPEAVEDVADRSQECFGCQ